MNVKSGVMIDERQNHDSQSYRAKFDLLWFIAHQSHSALALAADPQTPAANSDGKSQRLRRPSTVLRLDPYAGYARTKMFGLEAQGTKFVYVFDRSGSMGEIGGKPLRDAKAELLSQPQRFGSAAAVLHRVLQRKTAAI